MKAYQNKELRDKRNQVVKAITALYPVFKEVFCDGDCQYCAVNIHLAGEDFCAFTGLTAKLANIAQHEYNGFSRENPKWGWEPTEDDAKTNLHHVITMDANEMSVWLSNTLTDCSCCKQEDEDDCNHQCLNNREDWLKSDYEGEF